MGGTVVSLIDLVLRDQESLPPSERNRCLIVCDEFQSVTGCDWGNMLAETRNNCYARITSDTETFHTFSRQTLSAPDETEGSAEAVALVLEQSKAYTRPRDEIQAELYAETLRRLKNASMGGGSVSEVVGSSSSVERETAVVRWPC